MDKADNSWNPDGLQSLKQLGLAVNSYNVVEPARAYSELIQCG